MNHVIHYPHASAREERPSRWSPAIDHEVDYKTQSSVIQSLLPYLETCEANDAFGAIGTMELLQVLGKGGMGCVCLAYDTALERTIAIKFLLPHLIHDDIAFTRFLREARAAAALSHANLMPIYVIGEIGGLPYLVMPYVAGGSLENVMVQNVPLPLDQTINYASQIATGLAAAHAVGLIHRDIKPANVMVDTNDHRLIITDFGLARDIHEPSNLTISGNPLGTPTYFSPEQASGEEVDHRSDLYSLGVLLYRMATGTEPFPMEDPIVMMLKHATVAPTPPVKVQADIPAWLNQLILQLMEKDPAARPSSTLEVLQQLHQAHHTQSDRFEEERLSALQRLKILDTETEQCFDDLVSLASHVCDTPIALMSLVDRERQWFKARVGVDSQQTHRNLSFCAHAIKQAGPFVVPDATQDERFVENDLVTGDPHIRFYAGMPLLSPEGYGLGTLCVIDRTPRELTKEQEDALSALSRLAMTLMDHRRVLKQFIQEPGSLQGSKEARTLVESS